VDQKRPTAAIRPAYSVLDLSPLPAQIGRLPRPWQKALAIIKPPSRKVDFSRRAEKSIRMTCGILSHHHDSANVPSASEPR